MFLDSLNDSPLCNKIVEESGVFSKLQSAVYHFADCSGVSTVRALIFPRLRDNESFSFGVVDVRNSHSLDTSDFKTYESSLVIINITDDDNYSSDYINGMNYNFNTNNPGYIINEPVTKFLAARFPAKCWVNPEKHTSLIFTEALDRKRWRILQTVFLSAVPWLLSRKGLNEDEKELLLSLNADTKDRYIECLKKIAAPYKFEEIYAEQKIAKFLTSQRTENIDNTKRQLERLISDVNATKKRLSELISGINNCNLQIAMQEEALRRENGTDKTILEYVNNADIHIVPSENDDLRFWVSGVIETWDQDAFEAILDNPYSYMSLYNRNTAELLKAIFIDEKFKIRTCAAYYLKEGYAVGIRNFEFPDDDCLPNTHINRYSCMGAFESLVAEAMAKGDILSAMEYCVQSAYSLNVNDSVVMKGFIDELEKTKKPCLMDNNGVVYTPLEALEVLKNEQ